MGPCPPLGQIWANYNAIASLLKHLSTLGEDTYTPAQTVPRRQQNTQSIPESQLRSSPGSCNRT